MKTIVRVVLFASLFILSAAAALPQQVSPTLQLNDKEYFEMPGLNVMCFQGHLSGGTQAGVSIILNGVRIATNGDIRLDTTPGQ
jgi:endoglucanase